MSKKEKRDKLIKAIKNDATPLELVEGGFCVSMADARRLITAIKK